MKLMPASRAAWMTAIESSWSGLPQAPNIMAPRQSGLTWTPVLPRVRYSIQRPYPALVVEQLALDVEPAGVPGELAGGADGARGVRPPELARELAVGDRLAVGDLDEQVPDAPLELGAAGGEREVEA